MLANNTQNVTPNVDLDAPKGHYSQPEPLSPDLPTAPNSARFHEPQDVRHEVERVLDLYVRLGEIGGESSAGAGVIDETRLTAADRRTARRRQTEERPTSKEAADQWDTARLRCAVWTKPSYPPGITGKDPKPGETRSAAPLLSVARVIRGKGGQPSYPKGWADSDPQQWRLSIGQKLARMNRMCVCRSGIGVSGVARAELLKVISEALALLEEPDDRAKRLKAFDVQCIHVITLIIAAELKIEVKASQNVAKEQTNRLQSPTQRKRMGAADVEEAHQIRADHRARAAAFSVPRVSIIRTSIYDEAVDLFAFACSTDAKTQRYCLMV